MEVAAMSGSSEIGEVRYEANGRVFKIVIDNVAKRNSFNTRDDAAAVDPLTEFDSNDNFWAAVLCAAGDHFTAGLGMPQVFGPGAAAKPVPEGKLAPFGLRNRTFKPVITAVQGISYTAGIELLLAGDIVIAADTARVCQMESRRGIAPLGVPIVAFRHARAGATRCIT
jgi:enoyl-CoA hydratase